MKTLQRRNAGVTMLEMMIVLSLFSVVAISVYSVTSSTVVASQYIQATSEMISWVQKGTNDIAGDVGQSRTLFQRDAKGIAYLAVLVRSVGSPAPTNPQTLPLVSETGNFTSDPDPLVGNKTGNTLFFTRTEIPYSFEVVPGTTRRCDVVRMLQFYQTKVTGKRLGAKADALRLMKWQSVEFGDYGQVMLIADAGQRATFVAALYTNRGVRALWDASAALPNAAFRPISALGVISGISAAYTITESSCTSVVPGLGYGAVSVAWNTGGTFFLPDACPKYAVATQTNDGFPNGLETQIIGPSGARQVLITLTLARWMTVDNRMLSRRSFVIATAKDF